MSRKDSLRHTLALALLLILSGCCHHPKPVGTPVLEVRDDGCWRIDDCNWCCPMLPLDPNSAYTCTLIGCVKELPK